jgi:hypothetical protein
LSTSSQRPGSPTADEVIDVILGVLQMRAMADAADKRGDAVASTAWNRLADTTLAAVLPEGGAR